MASARLPREATSPLPGRNPSTANPNSHSPRPPHPPPLPLAGDPAPPMAAGHPREATPPPVIGKAGSLTVFITPPTPTATPKSPTPTPKASGAPRSNGASPGPSPAVKTAPPPPPVQVPPPQFEKAAASTSTSSGSVFGFFWDAVAKVQDMHSSLDEYLADWFGLDQSKYQWALNDYYENNGKEKEVGKGNKPKELNSKGQVV